MRWTSIPPSMAALALALAACSDDGSTEGGFGLSFGNLETTGEPGDGDGDPAGDGDGDPAGDGDGDGDGDPAPECGNGIVEDGEECDDGPANADTAACKSDCTAAVCGDGFVGPREACDDGNKEDGDDCSNACVPSTCGNGVLEGSEQCDDGNMIVSDACLPNCTNASCGDGYIWVGMEECDDEGESSQCDADCTLVSCGDGVVNLAAGEACDDGNDVNTDDCLDSCEAASCGDGFLHEGVETCDGDELGPETCVSQGFLFGDIACDAECNYDIADCNNEQPCPDGGAFVNDYCWYASNVCESASAKCASVGLTGANGYINSVWDQATMDEVAAQLGLISGGVNGCCVTFGWIQNNTIYTHNFGAQFYNWPNCFSNWPTLKACNPPP